MDPDLGWIDLGVRPVVDSSFERRAKAATEPAMREAGESAGRAFGDEAGDEATAGLSAKVKDWSKKGAVALGGGLGLAIGVGLRGGLERESIGDVVAAGLGLSPREQERQGKIAGSLYAHAFGDSYEDVARGVAAVQSSLPGLDGNGEIRRASADALNFAQVFGVEVPRSVQLARTIITSGLAKDAEAAFDLMVRASQKVPENVREDVLDTAEEYGQFFKTLGYDGKQAFDLLVASAGLGVYGVDKAGDAIKEFTILATDGSKASGDAYKVIGLNAREMANQILAGGDDAQEATQKIVAGLLDIEDPGKRAQTAIALFGTPLEDLNVRKIPAFLRALQGSAGELDKVKGAADRMGDTLADNVGTNVTKVKRKLETDLINFMSEKGLPALESFSDWMNEDGVPLLKDTAEYGGKAAAVIGDMVGFLNDLPDPAKYAGLAALVTGVAAVKIRGGGNGLTGSVGSALGLAKPVPVLVTNPGFGSGGPGTTVVTPDGTDDKNTKRNGRAAGVAGLLAGIFSEDLVDEITAELMFPVNELKRIDREQKQDPLTFETQEQAVEFLDAAKAKAEGFGRELDLIGGKKVEPLFAVPGLAKGREGLAEFIRLQIEAKKPVTPYIHTTGIERAIGLARTLNAELRAQAQVERGVDNGATYQHGGTPASNRRYGHGGSRRP